MGPYCALYWQISTTSGREIRGDLPRSQELIGRAYCIAGALSVRPLDALLRRPVASATRFLGDRTALHSSMLKTWIIPRPHGAPTVLKETSRRPSRDQWRLGWFLRSPWGCLFNANSTWQHLPGWRALRWWRGCSSRRRVAVGCGHCGRHPCWCPPPPTAAGQHSWRGPPGRPRVTQTDLQVHHGLM